MRKGRRAIDGHCIKRINGRLRFSHTLLPVTLDLGCDLNLCLDYNIIRHNTSTIAGYKEQGPTVSVPVRLQRVSFDPELGSRGPNAAKNYLNHTPFGFRPLQLVVRGVVHR